MQVTKDNWGATSHTSTLFQRNMKPVEPTFYAVLTWSFPGRQSSAKCKLLGKVTMLEAHRRAANRITEKKAVPMSGIMQDDDLEDLSLLLDWELLFFLPSQPPPVAFLFLLLTVALQFLLLTSKQPLLLRNGSYFCLGDFFGTVRWTALASCWHSCSAGSTQNHPIWLAHTLCAFFPIPRIPQKTDRVHHTLRRNS